MMGYSRDEHPWVGPLPNKPGLYVSAGYTGHGMPNTWLCGKAVAKMVEQDLLFGRAKEPVAHSGLISELALNVARVVRVPECYFVSEARIERAMELQDVAAVDWAEMERARRRRGVDQMPSGYA